MVLSEQVHDTFSKIAHVSPYNEAEVSTFNQFIMDYVVADLVLCPAGVGPVS